MGFNVKPWHFLTLLLLQWACQSSPSDTQKPRANTEPALSLTPQLTYSVVDTFSHPILNFTEGLLVHRGQCIESTGSPDGRPDLKSQIGILNLSSGAFSVTAQLDKEFFGEGIAVLNSTCYQVTYKHQSGFLYDAQKFSAKGRFSYPNKEGWGLTTDGRYLIMSDGTHELSYFEPETFAPVKKIEVTEGGFAIPHLNELEYIKGFVYANIWMSNEVVKINTSTGQVVGRFDFSKLREHAYQSFQGIAEMNGIAYDSASGHLLVTGKLWPYLYALRVDL